MRASGPRKNANINARRAETHKMGNSIIPDEPTIDEKEEVRAKRRVTSDNKITDILRGVQEQARLEARRKDVVVPAPPPPTAQATPTAASAAAVLEALEKEEEEEASSTKGSVEKKTKN